MEKMILMEFADGFRMKTIPYKLSKVFQFVFILMVFGFFVWLYEWEWDRAGFLTSPVLIFQLVVANGIIAGEQPKIFFMLPGSISKYMRAKVKVIIILEEISLILSLAANLIAANYINKIDTLIISKRIVVSDNLADIMLLFLFYTTNIFFINAAMMYFNYTVEGKLKNSLLKKIVIYLTYIWIMAFLIFIDHMAADIIFIVFSVSIIVIAICIINNTKNKLKMINHWIAREESEK